MWVLGFFVSGRIFVSVQFQVSISVQFSLRQPIVGSFLLWFARCLNSFSGLDLVTLFCSVLH